MPACSPRTPCTFCGCAYGIALPHNRPSTNHVSVCVPFSADPFLDGVELSSTCPCHDHTLSCCWPRTQRRVHLHDLPESCTPRRTTSFHPRTLDLDFRLRLRLDLLGWRDNSNIAALAIPVAVTVLNVSLVFGIKLQFHAQVLNY